MANPDTSVDGRDKLSQKWSFKMSHLERDLSLMIIYVSNK